LGDDGERGVGGPLHVSIRNAKTPLTTAIIDVAGQLGTPFKEDINRPKQEGIGYCPVTIRNGRRVSAVNAFLDPVRNRRNLDIVTGVEIDRVLFSEGKAIGVAGRRSNSPIQYRCSKEVILSCGTIQSPKLLMLSGIGK